MLTRIAGGCITICVAIAASGCSKSDAQAREKEKECAVEVDPVGHANECPSGQIRFHFKLAGCSGSKGTFEYVYTTKDAGGKHGPFVKGGAWIRPGNTEWEQTEYPSLACGEQFHEIDVLTKKTTCRCMGD